MIGGMHGGVQCNGRARRCGAAEKCSGDNRADDFDVIGAGAGAVVLAEVDSLPSAEDELAVVNDHGDGGAGEDGFDVGVGIAFGVVVIGFALWDQFGEFLQDVVFDVWVGVFVDADGGGGVGDVDDAEAVLDA